jgi:2,3-bisphosphoglycerate-dependent phosphoglycerate mutase
VVTRRHPYGKNATQIDRHADHTPGAASTFWKFGEMIVHAAPTPMTLEGVRGCWSSSGATLALMRHGESEGNRRKVFTGWIDMPLTDSGRAEAESAAMSMKQAEIVFDQIFTSDLARARESAEIAVACLGGATPLTIRSALRERNYGALSGRDKEDVFREFGRERVQRWRRSYAESPPDGESLKDTLERVRPIFEREIVPFLLARCNVLVVAHGSSLRALIVLIEGRAPEQIGEVEIATGEVLCYCVR